MVTLYVYVHVAPVLLIKTSRGRPCLKGSKKEIYVATVSVSELQYRSFFTAHSLRIPDEVQGQGGHIHGVLRLGHINAGWKVCGRSRDVHGRQQLTQVQYDS